jgi:hypothetical protein
VTRGDRLLIAFIALAVVASVPISASALVHRGNVAEVRGPAGSSTLDLRDDGLYTIQGRGGAVVLQVADGSVRCIQADCPDGVCIHSGAARPGRPIVCAPNGVTVSVSTAQQGGVDAVSR